MPRSWKTVAYLPPTMRCTSPKAASRSADPACVLRDAAHAPVGSLIALHCIRLGAEAMHPSMRKSPTLAHRLALGGEPVRPLHVVSLSMSLRYCGALALPVAITKSLNCAKSHASPLPIDESPVVSLMLAVLTNRLSSVPPTMTDDPVLLYSCSAPCTVSDTVSSCPTRPRNRP